MNESERRYEYAETAPRTPEASPRAPELEEVVDLARAWARENPHVAVGAALGVGFLLGGGLTPRVLGAVAILAARHSLKQSAAEILGSVMPGQAGVDDSTLR